MLLSCARVLFLGGSQLDTRQVRDVLNIEIRGGHGREAGDKPKKGNPLKTPVLLLEQTLTFIYRLGWLPLRNQANLPTTNLGCELAVGAILMRPSGARLCEPQQVDSDRRAGFVTAPGGLRGYCWSPARAPLEMT
jgi:hypothetical protein